MLAPKHVQITRVSAIVQFSADDVVGCIELRLDQLKPSTEPLSGWQRIVRPLLLTFGSSWASQMWKQLFPRKQSAALSPELLLQLSTELIARDAAVDSTGWRAQSGGRGEDDVIAGVNRVKDDAHLSEIAE